MAPHAFRLILLTCSLMISAVASPQGTAPSAVADGNSTSLILARIEHQVEAAIQRGDSSFLNDVLGTDFRFRHGTGQVDGKQETVAVFARPGNFISRTLTAVEVEVHGTVAVTNGRIEVRSTAFRDYTVCYIRLYASRDGRWRLLSHRTYRQGSGFSETCAAR